MGGESIYYGLNTLSNNLIMADRKKLKNPNGLILGTPGSGKSFAAKREITNVFIVTKDDIIICDPEGEYFPLVRAFNGQVIRISPTSRDYINPMDININYADDDDPLSLKSDFILSLCELVVGGKNGLEPVEKQSLTDVYVWYIRTILLIRSRRTCQSWKIYIICFANRKRQSRRDWQLHWKSM